MSADVQQIPSLDPDTIPVIFLLQLPDNITDQLKNALSQPDSEWKDRPSISPPPLSFIPWPRSSEGTNSDLYRIAAQAKANEQSSAIFVDGKSAKDGSVLITRMLEGGKLTIRRIPAGRATLGLKACEERGVGVEEAPVGRFKSGLLRADLFHPFQTPFNYGGEIERKEESDSNPRNLTSIPKEVEVNPDRPVVISLTPGATVEALLEKTNGSDRKKLSVAEIDFYPWIGFSEGTRADLYRIFYATKFKHSWATNPGHRGQKRSSKLALIKNSSAEGNYNLLYVQALSNDKNLSIFRLAQRDLGLAWSEICGFYRSPIQHDPNLLDYSNKELLVDPDGFMYGKDRPPWLPDDVMSVGGVPPMFFLAKFSQDEDNGVMEELETFTEIELDLLESGHMDEKKDYCFVPWEKDEDGTEVDMLRIAKETGLSTMIFIDRQTLEDKSVILTDSHYEYDEDEEGRKIYDGKHQRKLGLDWGRAPGREARLSWINLDIANLGLDETVMDEPKLIPFVLLEQGADGDGKNREGYDFRSSTKRKAEKANEDDATPPAKVAKT